MHLRAVINIRPQVELVGRHEGDSGFRIMWEGKTSDHLEIQLKIVSDAGCSSEAILIPGHSHRASLDHPFE